MGAPQVITGAGYRRVGRVEEKIVVDCFVVCVKAMSQGGVLSIGKIIDDVGIDQLPFPDFPGEIVTRLRFPTIRTGTHELEFRVVDPDGKKLDYQIFDIDVTVISGLPYGLFSHILKPSNTKIEQYGPYVVELWLDKELQSAYPFRIRPKRRK